MAVTYGKRRPSGIMDRCIQSREWTPLESSHWWHWTLLYIENYLLRLCIILCSTKPAVLFTEPSLFIWAFLSCCIFIYFFFVLIACPVWKCAFALSNLFLIEIVGGKRGEMRLIPCSSGTRLLPVAGHVWRSQGTAEITQIPKSSREHRGHIQGRDGRKADPGSSHLQVKEKRQCPSHMDVTAKVHRGVWTLLLLSCWSAAA